MSHITKKITIHAPVYKVYRFITTPENWTRYVPHLMGVRDISSTGLRRGTTFRWTYRKFGINLHGRGEITENIKDHSFGLKMQGAVTVQEFYTLAPCKKGTELYADIDYGIPQKIINVVKKIRIIENINKKDADNILDRIKILCEET
jgi:hypothetical protein